jgi:hypothetical protein
MPIPILLARMGIKGGIQDIDRKAAKPTFAG